MAVIDTTTNSVVRSIPVGGRPFGVGVTPDSSKVYVAKNSAEFANSVSVIDTTTSAVVATIPVGNNPVAFGLFIGPPKAEFAGDA